MYRVYKQHWQIRCPIYVQNDFNAKEHDSSGFWPRRNGHKLVVGGSSFQPLERIS
jgi:hypothetical protein